MRRLEHACARELTSANPKLDIHLGAVTYVDATARAILQCLEARGIRLMHTVEPPTITSVRGHSQCSAPRHPRRGASRPSPEPKTDSE
jgi:hypothetical protein